MRSIMSSWQAPSVSALHLTLCATRSTLYEKIWQIAGGGIQQSGSWNMQNYWSFFKLELELLEMKLVVPASADVAIVAVFFPYQQWITCMWKVLLITCNAVALGSAELYRKSINPVAHDSHTQHTLCIYFSSQLSGLLRCTSNVTKQC